MLTQLTAPFLHVWNAAERQGASAGAALGPLPSASLLSCIVAAGV